jgi:hypothetical protein
MPCGGQVFGITGPQVLKIQKIIKSVSTLIAFFRYKDVRGCLKKACKNAIVKRGSLPVLNAL